jgi:uncharacterized membrane protein YdjX (TVP38/TMEM64 family)
VRLLAAAAGAAGAAGAAVGVTVVISAHNGVPGTDQLRAEFGGHRWWQPVLFAGLYALATLTPLPKTLLTLGAGALFGVTVGLPVVLVGATAGALAAFALTRTLGRGIDWPGAPARSPLLRRSLGRYRVHTDQLHRLLDDKGLLTVTALRLVPIVPFTALNYAAGFTRVRIWNFTAGTILGMVPATAAYVTLGAFHARPGTWPVWLSLAGLLLLSVAGVVVRRSHRTRERAPSGRQQDARHGNAPPTTSAELSPADASGAARTPHAAHPLPAAAAAAATRCAPGDVQ